MTDKSASYVNKPAAHPVLGVIKTYLDLISGETVLMPGSGIRKLYAMSSGVATFNERDLSAIADKADRLDFSSASIHHFVNTCVTRNIALYGRELLTFITNRISDIAVGNVVDLQATMKYNAVRARRPYYTPPVPFINSVRKALEQDQRYAYNGNASYTFSDAVVDADLMLTEMTITEGYITPTQSAWGNLVKVVEDLAEVLNSEARYTTTTSDYKEKARPALKILWVIAKLLAGDLTIRPDRQQVNFADLDNKINLTDGTLACIPFPLPETVKLFQDDEGRGMTLKGHTYLSAASTALFYSQPDMS